jgi:uncharacterized protein (DUF1697 family)
MATYVALLRAVNVGGTGKLTMADLKALCAELGFSRIETYIASGNVVFDCDLSPQSVQTKLAARLLADAGKPVGVLLRTAGEMAAILRTQPFPDRDPKQTYAFFLDAKPAAEVLVDVRGRDREEIHLCTREIYVYYPKGMGQSKLRIPAAAAGTARNLNTVAKLAELSARP